MTNTPHEVEWRTVKVLAYDRTPGQPIREPGDTCRRLEADGWEIKSIAAGQPNAHWATCEFWIVARRSTPGETERGR